ncbi:MAG: pilus assembly protein TadG-related protein [Pseudomonadota bacterium]
MSFFRGVGRFARDCRGGTMLVFAVCFVPIILAVGFAADFGFYLTHKKKVQQALDMAGLAAARHVSDHLGSNNATLQTIADDLFKSELAKDTFITMQDVTVVRNGMRVNLAVEGTMPTSFMHLAGVSTMALSSTSEVVYGVPSKAEIVLVLDTSTSMTNVDTGETESRIESLRTAAKDMVSVLLTPSATIPVEVAIVPFSNMVNVGMGQASETWLSVPADYEYTEQDCRPPDSWYEANCTPDTQACGEDGVAGSCGTWDCTGHDEGAASVCTDVDYTVPWNGCVQPRTDANHLKDQAYTTDQIPGIVSTNANACASPIVPLSSNQTHLEGKIDALGVRNETYIPTGLIWGLRMLTNTDPFPADDSISNFMATGGVKSIVLMSDGANTLAPDITGEVTDVDLSDANPNTAEVCQTIKDAGVEIYVVAYDITDVTTTTLLENCASSATRFYEASSSDELKSAFETITKQLARDLAIAG